VLEITYGQQLLVALRLNWGGISIVSCKNDCITTNVITMLSCKTMNVNCMGRLQMCFLLTQNGWVLMIN